MNDETKQKYGPAMTALTSLFFMVGFVTALNGILIPHLRGLFNLSPFTGQFVNSAFFIAYFVMGTPSSLLIKKVGYKMGCVAGLLVSALGAMLFFPAAGLQSFPLFLVATFVLATGSTILQTASNPFATLLGPPEGASSRLNMVQAFNSLGTTLAPWFGNLLILMVITDVMTQVQKAQAVRMPYGLVAGVFIVLAVLFAFFKLPDPAKLEKKEEGASVADTPFESLHKSAWGYKHLWLGVIGIFCYVGAEVAIGMNIIDFLSEKSVGGLTASAAAVYVSIYWGGAMIGRFFGALWLTQEGRTSKKYGYSVAIILFAFLVGAFVTTKPLTMPTIVSAKYGLVFMGIAVANFIAFQIGKKSPRSSLGIFASIAGILVLIAVLASGATAMWALISVGFFNSIMFPTIFSLAVDKLGKHTHEGSGALIMGIVGGAVIPPIYGMMAGYMGFQKGFIVCVLCYLYIAFFGIKGSVPESIEKAA